jgi:hypothetical protein
MMVARTSSFSIGLLLIAALIGCARIRHAWTQPADESILTTPNPLPVAMGNRDWVMDVVSDELDDHFRIAREQRVRLLDSILTEGWIETHPRIGSTMLEPWHRDSQPGFEKLHSTLQTVRRFARVRIIPSLDQYWIDLKVYKELEDLPQPMGSTVGGRLSRHDNSIDADEPYPVMPANAGWIPLGRDFALEQAILSRLEERFAKGCPSDGPAQPY